MHLSICLHGFAQRLLAVHSHFSATASHPCISGKCLSDMTNNFQPHTNYCKNHFLIKMSFDNPFLSYQLKLLETNTIHIFIIHIILKKKKQLWKSTDRSYGDPFQTTSKAKEAHKLFSRQK